MNSSFMYEIGKLPEGKDDDRNGINISTDINDYKIDY